MAENDQVPCRPPPMRASNRAALSVALCALHLGEDLTDEVLIPAERAGIEARRRSLARDMRWGTRAEIADVLKTIKLTMGGTERLTPEHAARKLDQEIHDLSDVPFWALLESAKAFRRGDVGDGKWRPRSGQLRKLAMQLAGPFIEEMAQMERVLAAPIVETRTPADRKVMLGKLRAVVSEFTKKSA
jgi:hypothetical protein